MTDAQGKPIAAPSLLIAAAVSAALAWSMFSGNLARLLPLPGIPYLRSGVATLSDLGLMIGLAALAARRSPAWVLDLTGAADIRARHLAWAAAVFAPVVVAGGLLTPLAAGLGPEDFVWPSIIGPFAEELFYRGLAVGLLMRAAGWRFLPAALWPALFFGVAHLWQGSDPVEAAGVVAITGFGGLLFGWLFVRWGYALWPPVLAHVGMNALWTAFALGDNAVGGLLGNGLRAATVILIVALTLWLAPRPAPRGSP